MLCILSFKVMFELIPKHRSAVTSDQHVLIINNSPIEYGHSLLVPSINSCLPQVFALNDFLMSLFFVCSSPSALVGRLLERFISNS